MLGAEIDEESTRNQASATLARSYPTAYRASGNVQIRILERPTNSTLIIHWRDPGRCFYGHQSWRITKARIAGHCVVSRVAIQKGDDVFRPAYTNAPPQNAQAMILASAVYGAGDRMPV
ncbi:DUF3331 domain-containing protein [Burkholderia sp. Ac-20365]|uniref:DUF3331 domain-containing protein n=1 Tax=Burkholderia sp. Ac-20365 TaxID=2703897 RepID=UPI00197C1D5B|nr:DUF3331 domain-containing protein [Burkholderia sp. Ac-20365]MBN3759204.1 DUF3331 domain-containing protein [Burkholderia sp. Ac-20365]